MLEMRKGLALVLGAAGFVGRHTALSLSQQGYAVYGLGHGNWLDDEWHQWGLSKWLNMDISIEALDLLLNDETPSCIIHCGGSGAVSFSYANPLQDFERATQSTVQVLEWIRLNSPLTCRFVLVSSAAIYGDQGDTNASESSVRAPISPYGVHKLVAETICESYSRFFNVSSSVVRLFSVYGEGLRKQLLWDALNKFNNGEVKFFGTGNELRDWIHVEDAARLLALAGISTQSKFEIYNGGSEHASTRYVITSLAFEWGQNQHPVFSGETHKGNPHRLTADCSHSKRLLDWSPTVRLEKGLKRYVNWYRLEYDKSNS
jgi:UDP-glucose 4-epimerase